jgi:hypothetical protein
MTVIERFKNVILLDGVAFYTRKNKG